MKLEIEPVVAGAVGKVKIQPLRRDFQAEGESPVFGLFHGAAFSTALLPTNSAKKPEKNKRVVRSCFIGYLGKGFGNTVSRRIRIQQQECAAASEETSSVTSQNIRNLASIGARKAQRRDMGIHIPVNTNSENKKLRSRLLHPTRCACKECPVSGAPVVVLQIWTV